MNASDNYRIAEIGKSFSNWIFWTVFSGSATFLLLPNIGYLIEPIIIVATVAGIIAGFVLNIFQNRGNRMLRASLLTDAFGVALGDSVRDGYYNNSLPESIDRLALNILENTLFSNVVLSKMLAKERIAISLYAILYVFLLAYRGTSLTFLVLLTQSLFSADLLLNWLKMERFQMRVAEVHRSLKQYFLHGGSAKKNNKTAIILAAFSDYECAKDEASLPLSRKIFNEINSSVSETWDKMRISIHIE